MRCGVEVVERNLAAAKIDRVSRIRPALVEIQGGIIHAPRSGEDDCAVGIDGKALHLIGDREGKDGELGHQGAVGVEAIGGEDRVVLVACGCGEAMRGIGLIAARAVEFADEDIVLIRKAEGCGGIHMQDIHCLDGVSVLGGQEVRIAEDIELSRSAVTLICVVRNIDIVADHGNAAAVPLGGLCLSEIDGQELFGLVMFVHQVNFHSVSVVAAVQIDLALGVIAESLRHKSRMDGGQGRDGVAVAIIVGVDVVLCEMQDRQCQNDDCEQRQEDNADNLEDLLENFHGDVPFFTVWDDYSIPCVRGFVKRSCANAQMKLASPNFIINFRLKINYKSAK